LPKTNVAIDRAARYRRKSFAVRVFPHVILGRVEGAMHVFQPLTTARERGSDIIDLQDFAGHADPRTTLTCIRSRDRLSKSPAYVLKY
jgi:hypothetical protein